VIKEICQLAGVNEAQAYLILEKLWAIGINFSEISQPAFKAAVKDAAASI